MPWMPPEDCEQVKVTPEALEETLSSLMAWIPKDQQKAARQVAWLLLMALKLKHAGKETLQARVHVLEQEGAFLGQEEPGELEPTDSSKDSVTTGAVAPVLQHLLWHSTR